MPVITLEMSKMTKDKKTELARELTQTASKITGIPEQGFYVFINEHESENVGVGGILLSERNK